MKFQEALEKLVKSNAWNAEWRVPSVPMHSNPHLYNAYALKLLDRYPAPVYLLESVTFLVKDVLKFIYAHEVAQGVVVRQIGAKGLSSSHDEIMGAAYVSTEFAARALHHFSKNDGVILREGSDFDYELRFIYFVPFLKACVAVNDPEQRVGFFSQAAYSIHLLVNIYKARKKIKSGEHPEASGILKIWLMNDRMKNHFWSGLVIKFWKNYFVKRGYTAKYLFGFFYLVECPVFAELAMEDLD